jgi:hypothetical protein
VVKEEASGFVAASTVVGEGKGEGSEPARERLQPTMLKASRVNVTDDPRIRSLPSESTMITPYDFCRKCLFSMMHATEHNGGVPDERSAFDDAIRIH